MPRTTVAVQELSLGGDAALTLSAADATNNHRIKIKDKATRVIFVNGTGAKVITVNSVAFGPLGRTGDLTVNIAADTTHVLSMLPKQGFEQGSGEDVGFVTFDVDDDTNLTIGAVEG